MPRGDEAFGAAPVCCICYVGEREAVTPRNKAREREARERETTGHEPFALHAPP